MRQANKSSRIQAALRVAAVAALLVFFLRLAPSFSQHLFASTQIDLFVPYRYISVGWTDWAAIQLKEMAELPDPPEELLLVLGLAHESLGEYEEALEAYGKAARLYAHDGAAVARAKALAANVNLQLGRPDVARELFLEANRLLPDQAFVCYGLGILAEYDGDTEGALEWFEKARRASPHWVDPAVKAASLYMRKGDAVTAVAILRPHEGRASRNAEFHLQIAAAYATLAVASAGSGLDPHQVDVLKSAGVWGEDLGSVLSELALHALDRTRQLDPEHPGLADLDRLISRIPPT